MASSGGGSQITITRTNDTNAYLANDVIGASVASGGAVQEFKGIGPSGGRLFITSAELEIDSTGVISGETSYVLQMYSITPPSALADNAPFDIPSGDRDAYRGCGEIPLGTPVDKGSTLYVRTDGINAQMALNSQSLFAYLVTVGPYTPTASRVYKVTLHTVIL